MSLATPASEVPTRPGRAFAALLAVAAAWYAWFIFRTSFVLGGERVFCLFDDAMVSMTYARNLLEGHGLNWARWGRPVEGFTHPLWVAVMTAANALPLPLRLRSLPVQAASLGLLLGNLALVRLLVLRHFTAGRARTWMPAAVLTAFCYPLVYWSLMGMETALQAALVTAMVLLGLDAVERGEGRHVAIWLLGAAAYLVRMDMLLPLVAVQAFVLTQGGVRRHQRGRWLAGLGLFAATVAGYQAFRWLYFGDLLPNTYYLKLSGVPIAVRLLRGLECLGDSLRANALLLLPVALGAGLLIARGREGRRYALPAAVFLLQCAYSVWVGGDAWEMDINVRANRFLAFALPMVFVIGNGLLNRLLAGVPAADGPEPGPGAAPARWVAAAAAAIALLVGNGLWLSSRATENWRNVLVTERPLLVVSHQIVYTQLLGLRPLAAPGAVVAAFWAGIPAYFSDYRMVDLLGYNDRHIARLPDQIGLNEDNFRAFRPGHVKWDARYVLDELRPEAFLQVYGIEKSGRVLPRRGYRKAGEYWLRPESPRIRLPAS
jgi:arabinofuranosyltransferase